MAAEQQQVTATAVCVGIPWLKAKGNIALAGLGTKFSGVYHVKKVRHEFGDGGYACELDLERNALGSGAGENAEPAMGKKPPQEPDVWDQMMET